MSVAPLDSPRSATLRDRWPIILAVTGLFAAVAAVVSLALPPVYTATAQVLVGGPSRASATYEQVQADQTYARTYARLMDSGALATRVVSGLSYASTPAAAEAAMSFAAVNDTPLIEVTAESGDRARAQELANRWARTFASDGAALLGGMPDPATVAVPAPLPTGPTRPRPLLYTAVAGLVGLVIGAAIATSGWAASWSARTMVHRSYLPRAPWRRRDAGQRERQPAETRT